jgi:hypothetical protein
MRKSAQQILADGSGKTEIRQWLAHASTAELQEFMRSVSASTNYYQYARDELDVRLAEAARQPHWTTTPAFWIAIVALIISILAWLRPVTPAAPSQPQNAAPLRP